MEDKKMSAEGIKKLEAVYERYAEYMYRVALKKLRNVENAKDCCQQSYEKLIRYIERLEDVDSQRTASYIYLVVHSVAIDMIRSQKHCVVTDCSKVIGMIENSHVEDEMNRRLVDACKGDFLEMALDVLDEEEKKLLMIRFGEDKTYKEIGEIMGLTETACRKRMQRIKAKLIGASERKGEEDGHKHNRYGHLRKDG